jgi:hypothetical protein
MLESRFRRHQPPFKTAVPVAGEIAKGDGCFNVKGRQAPERMGKHTDLIFILRCM